MVARQKLQNMGKQGKRKASVYEHVHTHNPKARESNERKLFNMQSLVIKRFQGYVDKIRDNMKSYYPPEAAATAKMGTRMVLCSVLSVLPLIFGFDRLPQIRSLS
jgi:hypothetical protein